MDINLNPGRVAGPGAGQTVARKAVKPPAEESDHLERSQSLERALKADPSVRSEKVAEARAKIADPRYPPMETLDSIANLLAMKVRA